MTNYIVTAPLVVIPNVDGTSGDGYFYEAAPVPKDWNPERCASLAKEGMLAEAKEASAPAAGTVEAILADVGDDKAKAQAALDSENAEEKPRKGLVGKLESIIGA